MFEHLSKMFGILFFQCLLYVVLHVCRISMFCICVSIWGLTGPLFVPTSTEKNAPWGGAHRDERLRAAGHVAVARAVGVGRWTSEPWGWKWSDMWFCDLMHLDLVDRVEHIFIYIYISYICCIYIYNNICHIYIYTIHTSSIYHLYIYIMSIFSDRFPLGWQVWFGPVEEDDDFEGCATRATALRELWQHVPCGYMEPISEDRREEMTRKIILVICKFYISMSIYVYLCLSMSIYVYLCLSMSIYVYLCLSMSIYVYLCLSMSIYVYLCLSMSIYVYLSIYLCLSIYLSMSIYLSIYLSLSLYIYICYRCLNIFSYFCSLYLHICHGQVPWLSFPMFPMLPVWRNEPLRETERYFSVDCRNCSGLGLKWIPMQFVTRFISNCHSTTRNSDVVCIRFHRLQVLISNQLSSWWSNWWEVTSLKCTEDDDLENLTFQFDVQILTSVHLNEFLVWGRFTNLQKAHLGIVTVRVNFQIVLFPKYELPPKWISGLVLDLCIWAHWIIGGKLLLHLALSPSQPILRAMGWPSGVFFIRFMKQ